MTTLPHSIGMVRVPDYFVPSALATFGGCKLRLVASQREWRDLFLPSGPEAAIGLVIHRVIEIWETGIGGSDPEALFDAQVERMRLELAVDPTRAHFSDLPRTMFFSEWLEKRAFAKSKCLRTARRVEQPSTGRQSTRTEPFGVEARLRSESMRLYGRADRVKRSGPRSFVVYDYKTGSVLDADGVVRNESAIQVRVYGMIVRELFPDCDVTLIVDDGHEHIVPFGRDEQAEVAQWLHGLMTALPAGAEISGVSLASPGSACRHCPIRHACGAYLKIAPSWWLRYPSEFGQIPVDTWGVVTETKTEESGVSVKIRDAAERSVKVAGLLERHQLGLDLLGQNLFFFNLVFTGTGRDRGGRRFFPHGFHEKPRDRGEWQAWGLQIFRGDTPLI